MATEEDFELPVQPEMLTPMVVVPEEVTETEYEDVDELEFDPRSKELFTGLMYVGKLEETVYVFGHSFQLATPSFNLKLESGLLQKPWLNTLSSELAWQAVTVAAYLLKVDGTDLPQAIGPKDSGLSGRLEWVNTNLNEQVIIDLFYKCIQLDAKVRNVMDEMRRLGESTG